LMLGESIWRTSVGHEVGHTLGCAESDIRDLPWMENSERLVCRQDHEFKTHGAARSEATALATAMDDLVWQRIIQGVSTKLTAVNDPALADAMEMVWRDWLTGFDGNSESRRQFLEQLLYPETEGKNATHALRLGPRTVDILVTAVELLLLVAVGVGGIGTAWKHFPACGGVLSIALKYWSGPAGG
ncbi:ABC-three component system protein, partial [Pseudomonas aeruginosa]